MSEEIRITDNLVKFVERERDRALLAKKKLAEAESEIMRLTRELNVEKEAFLAEHQACVDALGKLEDLKMQAVKIMENWVSIPEVEWDSVMGLNCESRDKLFAMGRRVKTQLPVPESELDAVLEIANDMLRKGIQPVFASKYIDGCIKPNESILRELIVPDKALVQEEEERVKRMDDVAKEHLRQLLNLSKDIVLLEESTVEERKKLEDAEKAIDNLTMKLNDAEKKLEKMTDDYNNVSLMLRMIGQFEAMKQKPEYQSAVSHYFRCKDYKGGTDNGM